MNNVIKDNMSPIDRQVHDYRLSSNLVLLYSSYPSIAALEKDYEAFSGQELEDQFMSNDESIRLFGKNNEDRYQYMLHDLYSTPTVDYREFEKTYIPPNRIVLDPLDRLYLCREMAVDPDYLDHVNASRFMRYIQENTSEFDLVHDKEAIKEEIMNDLESANMHDDVGVVYPFLTLDMMCNEDGYIDTIDDDHAKWLEAYKKLMTVGDKTKFTALFGYWKGILKDTYKKYKESENETDKNVYKHSLISLGWVPDIEPNDDTIQNASVLACDRLTNLLSKITIIDISPESGDTDHITPDIIDPYLYVVCRKANNKYNMIALSHDKEFKDCVEVGYNFGGTASRATPVSKSITLAGMDDTNVDIFVLYNDTDGREDLNKIYNAGPSGIESPFDSMIGNMSIDNAGGLKLFLYNLFNYCYFSVMDKHIYLYKIFSGRLKDYYTDHAESKLKALSALNKKTVRDLGLSESVTNEFPIEFDKDGNMLISKGKNLNVDGEYSRTHLALKMYEESNNIQGMKYCICKLWYLNIVLEDKIHDKKTKEDVRKECIKSRAKVMNDIKKYTPIIIKADPHFDILKTYQNSPFNNDKVSIKSSTLFYLYDSVKKFLTFKNLLK